MLLEYIIRPMEKNVKIFSPFDKNRLTRTNVRIIIQTPTESGKLNIAIRAQIARSENSAMAIFYCRWVVYLRLVHGRHEMFETTLWDNYTHLRFAFRDVLWAGLFLFSVGIKM